MPKMVMTVEQLLKPANPVKAKDRNVWGLPLKELWIPFLVATNVNGETHFSNDALGAPLRDRYNKDGTPKLSDKGERLQEVEKKEIAPAIKGIRENFAFGIATYTAQTQKAKPAEFKAQVEAAQKAGERIHAHEDSTFGSYLAALEQAKAAIAAAQNAPAAETNPETKTETPEKELVPA